MILLLIHAFAGVRSRLMVAFDRGRQSLEQLLIVYGCRHHRLLVISCGRRRSAGLGRTGRELDRGREDTLLPFLPAFVQTEHGAQPLRLLFRSTCEAALASLSLQTPLFLQREGRWTGNILLITLKAGTFPRRDILVAVLVVYVDFSDQAVDHGIQSVSFLLATFFALHFGELEGESCRAEGLFVFGVGLVTILFRDFPV